MHSAKKQGFIIRKSRMIGEQKLNQQRRHMSQTQFYRKSTPVSKRTPGLIIHLAHKNNSNLVNSHLYRVSKDDQQFDQSNPQYDLPNPQIKYQYEQNTSQLRQKGQQANIVLNDNSFQQINTNDEIPGRYLIKIEQNIKVAKILQKLYHKLQNRMYSIDILECVKQYVQYIDKNDIGDMNRISISLIRRKILKQSITYQRYGILLIGLIQVLDGFQIYKSYMLNIVNFTLDNLLLKLAILTQGKDKSVVQMLREQKKQKLLNKGYETVKNNNQMIYDSIMKVVKIDSTFCEAFKKLMKLNKTLDIKIQLSAVQQFIAYFLCQINKNQIAPFLSIAPSPYLPSQQFEKYTLVVDVLECLCTRNRKMIQAFRPFAQYFLDQMSQYFQIVSFSDVMPTQANKVISLLDRKKHIKHRLFKHHINKSKGVNGKDLTKLGRDMSKIILIDISKDPQDLNTVVISQWKGKRNDAELAQLCPILAMIALKKLNPQKAIKKLHQKNEQNMKIGFKHINCGINLQ